jgi:uncharacterized protein (TIGR02145 family)
MTASAKNIFPLYVVIAILMATSCTVNSVMYHSHRYPVVLVGNNYWMTENLQTRKFSNGRKIQFIINDSVWAECSLPACTAYNNNDSISSVYGLLYNWYAVDKANLCPAGWHVASDDDWLDLEKKAGGADRAGGRLMATRLWKTKIPHGDDFSFNALPSGYKREKSYNIGYTANWWTSTPYDSTYCWGRSIANTDEKLDNTLNQRSNGFSVRCVKAKKH